MYFRAILTSGSFAHYHLDNVECFFGEALVNAYSSEKSIPSLGLFMDSYCEKFNRFFRLAKFNDDLSFVYLNRSLETLEEYTGGKYPITVSGITDQAPHTPWQVRFLQDVYQNMRQHKSPMVRTKFLTAWDFYAKRYPSLTQVLVENNFALSSLAPKSAWSEETESMKKDIKYYKRIGSGTSLSVQLTKQGKYKSER